MKPLIPLAVTLALTAAPAAWASEAPTPRVVPVNLSLIQPLGFAQAFDEPVLNYLGLNLIAGQSYALRGLEFGTVYNGHDGYVDGVQFAGGVNHVRGPLAGGQMAGAFNLLGGELAGTQMSGLFNAAAESARGAQFAGGINLLRGDLTGAQMAGALNAVGGAARGFQASGAVNAVAGPVQGVQLAGAVNLAGGAMTGLQAAPVNVALDDFVGPQLGVINVAKKVTGLQVGVFNVADELEGIPVGLFSYVRQGRLEGDVSFNDLGFTTVGVNSGGRWAYSMLSLSYRPEATSQRLFASLGLGFNRDWSDHVYSKLELQSGGSALLSSPTATSGLLQTVRASVGYKLAPRVALKAGATLNGLWNFGDPVARITDRSWYDDGRVQVWPTLFIGADL